MGEARHFAAEATGKDVTFIRKVQAEGMSTDAYIETQIHGLLTWHDVDELRIGGKEADEVMAQFDAFKREEGYDFAITKK